MRIALLSAFCLLACTGPGLEPPEASGRAGAVGTHSQTGGSGGGGGSGAASGAGGFAHAGAGGLGGSGGDDPSLDAGVSDPGSVDQDRDLDTGWSDACGEVTSSGRCVGDVYEYCDYFARGLKQLDCGALGMTCRAGLQPGDGVETNGCVGEPCTTADERCEESFLVDCRDGQLLMIDCRKMHGPASACEVFHDAISEAEHLRCAIVEPCDTPNLLWCDEELMVICDEESKLHVVDCRAHAADGRCVVPVGSEPSCDPSAYD